MIVAAGGETSYAKKMFKAQVSFEPSSFSQTTSGLSKSGAPVWPVIKKKKPAPRNCHSMASA
jgi:hypothetical protein